MKKNYEVKPTQAPIHAPWKERPCYALQEGATPDEMREMAVRAMRDELTAPWTPNKDFTYHKRAACAREYRFYSNTGYAGLPYTTGGSGLLQWLDMMDPETGILYDADFENLGYNFGNSCAASVSWGAAAVCSSVQRPTSTYTFLPKCGWLPLGGVEIPEDLENYRQMGTHEVIEKNGAEKILQGYMEGKKGDAVVATANPELKDVKTANHCMMLIQEPVIVRNEDGSLNLEESKLIVQDQWSRNYDYPSKMQTLLTRGHTYKEQSFAELLKGKYVAVTTAEFLGLKPYEKAKAWMVGGETAEALRDAKVYSNYRPAAIGVAVTQEDGTVLFEKRDRTSGEEAVDYYLNGYEVKKLLTEDYAEALKTAGKKTVRVTDLLATGEEMTVATYEL